MTTVKLDKKFEGKAVAVLKGKVVLSNQSITKLIKQTNERYPNGEAVITTVPKGKKIFVI